jgi:phage terminase small subunit
MADVPDEDSLSDRQRMFVYAYIGEAAGNATQAALTAGYSKAGAAVQGHRLLRNPKVRARIDAILDAHGMSREEILFHLTEIARTPMAPFMQTESGYTDEEGRVHHVIIKLEYNSKVRALDLLAKIHRLLREKTDINITATSTIVCVPLDEARGA